MMQDEIVGAAQLAFSVRLKGSSHVGDNTKDAQRIAKAWRSAVHELGPDRFQIEAMVAPEFDQKIDIVDLESSCAYEFRVSGKGAHSEFYKDIVKVLLWNQRRTKKLKKFVFITEAEHGRRVLDAPMPRAYVNLLAGEGSRD
jgi:hypothetical protein